MAKEDPETRPDWNPMKDQYTDPKINAYRNMDLSQQPGFKAQQKMASPSNAGDSISKELANAQTNQSYEIHILGVPLTMTDEGLQNVFRKYGRIIKCFIAKPKVDSQQSKTWANITYGTQDEAQAAIENLDGRPPHKFSIKFALSKEELERRKKEDIVNIESGRHINQKLDDFQNRQRGQGPVQQLSERGQKLKDVAEANQVPQVQYGARGLPSNHDFRNESGEPDSELDEWCTLQGYVKIKPVLAAMNNANPSFDRTPWVFGYPKVFPYTPSQNCVLCGKIGSKRCSKCKAWYCSQICQINDWPRHKSICFEPPPLENADGSQYIPPSVRPLRRPAPESVVSASSSSVPENLPTLRQPFLNNNEHEVCKGKNPSEADTVSLKSEVETVKSGQRTKEDPKESREKLLKALVIEENTNEEPPKEQPKKSSNGFEHVPEGAKLSLKEVIQKQQDLNAAIEAENDLKEKKPEISKTPNVVEKKKASPKASPVKNVTFKEPKNDNSKGEVRKMANDAIKAVATPVKSPTIPPTGEKKFIQGIVEFLTVGETVEISADSEDEKINILEFMTVVVSNKIIDFLTGDMQTIGKTAKPATSANVGDFVLVLDKSEGEEFAMFARSIVLSKNEKGGINSFDIDMCKTISVPMNQVFQMPEQCYDRPALGGMSKSIGKMESNQTKHIKSLIDKQGTVNVKVTRMIPKKKGADASVECEVLDETSKPLAKYILNSWTGCIPEIPKALGWPATSDAHYLSDFEEASRQIRVGDEVVFVDFFQNSSKMVVMLKKHKHFEEPIMEVMETEFEKQDKIQIKDIEVNQVVACQWSEDEGHYRAVVRKVFIEDKKVAVRFLDYGNSSTESIENIRKLPETATSFPLLAKMVALDDVPEVLAKDVKFENKLKQLLPILNDFEVVEAKDKKFILKHPNGKTVNDIIKEKLSEPSDTAVPREIQGEEVDGQFNYDRVHIAALVPDKPDLLQEVVILHTESPQQIFVCPKNQIGLAETLVEKCEEYANIDKSMVGFSPSVGKICLAKGSDDGWYRAACISVNGEEYEMFFVDYGFIEKLPRTRMKTMHPKLMETVFLANHVVLEGFDDISKAEEYKKDFGEEIAGKLEAFSDTKMKVVKQDEESGRYIGRFKQLKDMKPKVDMNKTLEDKDDEIKKLQAQLAMLQGKA